jgi:hypothetical protein
MPEVAEKSPGDFAALNLCAPFDLMKFRLTYEGDLRASGNKPRPRDKWAIRKALHPQLWELWQTHPVLRRSPSFAHIPKTGGPFFHFDDYHQPDLVGPIRDDSNVIDLFAPIEVEGFRFRPLVRSSMHLACGLDIVFLRKEEPGALVLQGGDIDNRIKTLFDALKMPDKQDLATDQPDVDPFYTLLESDALITDCAIHTDRLLTRPGSSVHDVHLMIEVSIKVTRVGPWNMPLLGEP